MRWRSHLLPRPFSLRHLHGPDDAFSDWSVLKDYRQWEVNFTGPGSWAIFIPYWLILLPITLTWILLLLFRARRRRRRAITPALSEGTS